MKSCRICNKLVQKPAKYSYKQWAKFEYCSKSCWSIGRKEWKPKPETLLKMKLARLGKSAFWNIGKNNHFWKGGKTKKILVLRMSLAYKNWRKAVFERDGYTCIWCGYRGNNLQADHIMPFSMFERVRFDLFNGRTLCKDCHKKTETYGKRISEIYC